jgi:hypothetical protein
LVPDIVEDVGKSQAGKNNSDGLSEPVQVRIGILNQLSPEQIGEITSRFADAMLAKGAEFDKGKVMVGLKSYYPRRLRGPLRMPGKLTTEG